MSKALKAYISKEMKWTVKSLRTVKDDLNREWLYGYGSAMSVVMTKMLEKKRPVKAKRKARKGK